MPDTCHYYVDEGGDPVLFNQSKKSVVGTQGCSTFFVLGLLDVADPARLRAALEALRLELAGDPRFRNAPSLDPAQQKTALAFDAKDDLPEIRGKVFGLLLEQDVRFFAVVRDKRRIVMLMQQHDAARPEYLGHPNQLYHRSISRLFRDRLHRDDAYRVVFAKRGASDRTAALQGALENARTNFRVKWGIEASSPVEVMASAPEREPCLQAADYFVWSIQRLFERAEDHYVRLLWPKIRLVYDLDDTRRNADGEYYHERNPLTGEVIAQRTPGI